MPEEHVNASLCLLLLPLVSCDEIANGLMPQIATSDDRTRGLGHSAVKGSR
jgi:hypothetical protein